MIRCNIFSYRISQLQEMIMSLRNKYQPQTQDEGVKLIHEKIDQIWTERQQYKQKLEKLLLQIKQILIEDLNCQIPN